MLNRCYKPVNWVQKGVVSQDKSYDDPEFKDELDGNYLFNMTSLTGEYYVFSKKASAFSTTNLYYTDKQENADKIKMTYRNGYWLIKNFTTGKFLCAKSTISHGDTTVSWCDSEDGDKSRWYLTNAKGVNESENAYFIRSAVNDSEYIMGGVHVNNNGVVMKMLRICKLNDDGCGDDKSANNINGMKKIIEKKSPNLMFMFKRV